MHVPNPPHPRTPGRRLRIGASLALAGLALAGTARASRADVCSTCPPPTLADLQGQPGFSLETRYDDDGLPHEDFVQTDGGECGYALATAPSITIGKTWTVLRGAGTVFNCPWAKSDATVSISISDGDSTEWKVEGSVSAELGLAIGKLGGSLAAGVGGGLVHGEVRQLSQTLVAGPGHVVNWEGYFEIADLTLDATFDVTRRFAWWTKNEVTGHEVQRKGDLIVACGPTAARMTRQASIGGLFHLWDGRCDAATPPVDLGTFPRPRVPPETTPRDRPAPGAEADGGDDDVLPPLPQPPPTEPQAPPPQPLEPAPQEEPGEPLTPLLPPGPQAPGLPCPQESGELPPPPAGCGPFPPVGPPDAGVAR